jgi:hypothetical protein
MFVIIIDSESNIMLTLFMAVNEWFDSGVVFHGPNFLK